MNAFASNALLKSPCNSCDYAGDRNGEPCLYCQKKFDYLTAAFGEPKKDCAALYAKHQSELSLITPGRQLDFSGPGPKVRTFNCPICGVQVQTSHNAQRTCGENRCRKAHERLMDAARHERNREHNNKVERERRRRKRLMAGAMV